jgi:nucleoside permease NupC
MQVTINTIGLHFQKEKKKYRLASLVYIANIDVASLENEVQKIGAELNARRITVHIRRGHDW